MAGTAKRLNFMISTDIAEEFEALVPAGMRSKVVNDALGRELVRIKKQKVTEKLDTIKSKMPAISGSEITAALRADRERES